MWTSLEQRERHHYLHKVNVAAKDNVIIIYTNVEVAGRDEVIISYTNVNVGARENVIIIYTKWMSLKIKRTSS